mmetsp:Transcript_7612/g.11412  ORF Transcript_7612/g.11412 Transcript_7612/m.11412 type:complete len:557 (+) Transcript_7612:143-1813(+)
MQECADDAWMGIDLSTQSITVIILPNDGLSESVITEKLIFDEDLPHYNTVNGMNVTDNRVHGDNEVVTSPVYMWLDGLDIALTRLSKNDKALPFLSKISGISVSGQQHGTVYWKSGALSALKSMSSLPANLTLTETLNNCFSIRDCPIWADSSTAEQCSRLEEELGGPWNLAKITGSSAYSRFSGNQISKIAGNKPEIWANCERVSLVSSFVTSLLIGSYAPIDKADGSGMNLMDLEDGKWSQECVAATRAPSLETKLGQICNSFEIVGEVSPFFSEKYKLPKNCSVVSGSGDNPCSLAGVGAIGNDVVISLGTSDTIMGSTNETVTPGIDSHVMVSPIDPNAKFIMLVYKNGGLARERIRDNCADGSWEKFESILKLSRPGNEGVLGLFLDMPEITPQINRVGHFFFDAKGPGNFVGASSKSKEEIARACVEGRFLSMRSRLGKLGMKRFDKVYAVGGACNNKAITQIMANVFQANVYIGESSEAAAVGAALRAKHGVMCHRQSRFVPFGKALGKTLSNGKMIASPDKSTERCYGDLLEKYYRFETLVKDGNSDK